MKSIELNFWVMGFFFVLAVAGIWVMVMIECWKRDKELTSGSDPVVKFTGRCKGGEDEV